MTEIAIEQALFHRPDGEAPQLMARSPGFADEWLAEAEDLILGFGDRPGGVACPAAVFAHPLSANRVAVVQVADQVNDRGTVVLACHFLIIPQLAYERLLGDPFTVARRLPADWQARTSLPARSLPALPLPGRTVSEVQSVLQRIKASALPEGEDVRQDLVPSAENSESPALLGGVQALVDGGRLVFERPRADSGLIPALWTLLPTSTRARLWPASFAFSNRLGFDALVVQRATGPDFEGYMTEDQAADYPPGRYELNLQMAAEAGDQRQLDELFGRRSWAETWRLGVTLLVLVLFLSLAARVLDVLAPPAPPPTPPVLPRLTIAAGLVGMNDPWNVITLLPAARDAWNK